MTEIVRDLTDDMQAGLFPRRSPLGTAFGAELTLSSTHQRDDPTAEIVPILVRNVDGYRALFQLIGEAYLRAGDKDHVHYGQLELLDFVRAGHCWSSPVSPVVSYGRLSTAPALPPQRQNSPAV